MSFTRVNPSGWVQGDLLTPAQINQIDINQSRAIDGNAGGTYSPATPIIINGGGLQVDDLDVTILTAEGVSSVNGYEVPEYNGYRTLIHAMIDQTRWTLTFNDPTDIHYVAVAADSPIFFPFSHLYDGMEVTNWSVYFAGTGTTPHYSAITQPTAKFGYFKIEFGNKLEFTTVGSTIGDAQVSQAAYNASHRIGPPSAVSHVIANVKDRIYGVLLNGESGVSAETGGKVKFAEVYFKNTKVPTGE